MSPGRTRAVGTRSVPSTLYSVLSTRVPLTRPGLFWLLAATAALVLSLLRSINLLLLLACFLLAFLPLNLWLAGRRLRQLRAVRRLPQPIFAGTRFALEIDVVSPRGTILGLRLEDCGDAHEVAWFLPRLRKGEGMRLRGQVTLPRRGRYSWGAVRAWSGYPFGLAGRRALLTATEEIIVLPRLGHVRRGLLRRRLAMSAPRTAREQRPSRRDPAAQTDFHSLRAFRSGDSPRWIHWRTSARRGELMVREFEDEHTDNLIVVLDLGVEASAGDVEAAVSLAATVCWEWCRQRGDQLVLAVGGPKPVLIAGVTGEALAIRLLECLAVQPDVGGRAALLDRLGEELLPRAAVLLVTTRADGFVDELARRLGRSVACADVSCLAAVEFYEGPADHDA
jgi:uncharacterized protein (DUF58 family)